MPSLKELALHVDGIVHGDESCEISSVATLALAKEGQISFLSNPKYAKFLADTKASAVIVSDKMVKDLPSNGIVAADPYIAYAKIVHFLNPEAPLKNEIAQSAYISEKADIPDNLQVGHHTTIDDYTEVGDLSIIGHNTVIGQHVVIGKNARIGANVTICHGVVIGDNCIIHPGVVLGADGFGIANNQGEWLKIPQIGAVEIGNNVEIGANTTIDRGALENTVIGNGVKIDNQVQIAHNVVIGDHTAIAGCVGIAGSTTIGTKCIIGGGVGISGHIDITDNVLITGMTMVTKGIKEPGSYSSGIPVEPTKQWHKNTVRYRQLDKLSQRVKNLEQNALK